MNLPDLFTAGLEKRDGIYYAPGTVPISYPEDGNENCFVLEDNSFWFRHRNHCIISLVKKFSPEAIFFDIGGGNGYVSKGLQQSGVKTVLLEPGQAGCVNARRRGVQDVICATLEQAGFRAGSIDSAGFFDVMEHIEDDASFLQSLHKFMKPGGYIYLTVPAYQFLWSNEDVDAGHYRRYTLRLAEERLKQAGFTVEYSSYLFSFLILPILLFRSIPSKLGINKHSADLQRHQQAHNEGKGFVKSMVDRLLHRETEKIRKGRKIPWGTSCLLVARKMPLTN